MIRSFAHGFISTLQDSAEVDYGRGLKVGTRPSSDPKPKEEGKPAFIPNPYTDPNVPLLRTFMVSIRWYLRNLKGLLGGAGPFSGFWIGPSSRTQGGAPYIVYIHTHTHAHKPPFSKLLFPYTPFKDLWSDGRLLFIEPSTTRGHTPPHPKQGPNKLKIALYSALIHPSGAGGYIAGGSFFNPNMIISINSKRNLKPLQEKPEASFKNPDA